MLLDVPEDRGYRHSIVGVFERHHGRLEGTRRRSAGLAALLHHEPLSLLIAQTELGNGRGFGSPVRQALAQVGAALWQAERAVDRLWRGRSDMRRREFISRRGGAAA